MWLIYTYFQGSLSVASISKMTFSLDRWVGKVAVVTGASAGIGAAISEALVKKGIKVVGLARRKELIEQLASKLSGEEGKLYGVGADMTSEEDIIKAFAWVKENLGPIHMLINNAGIYQYTNLVEGDAQAWKRTFEVNVLGLSIATREAVKNMRENNVDGHIIHINSVLGHRFVPIPNINVYPATKFAVTALTETLRNELNSIGSKIKITSISPGFVKTDFARNASSSQEAFEARLRDNPGLVAEDVADATIYVLSTPPHVQVHELMLQAIGVP